MELKGGFIVRRQVEAEVLYQVLMRSQVPGVGVIPPLARPYKVVTIIEIGVIADVPELYNLNGESSVTSPAPNPVLSLHLASVAFS